MRYPILLIVLSLAMALSGCQLLGGYTIAKRATIDAQIDKARAEAAAKLDGLKTQEVAVLNGAIATHQAREQAAADHLFKGLATFGTLKPDQIGRPTLLMGQSMQLTATQLPSATPAAQAAAFVALQTELDETKTTTAQLVAKHEAELAGERAKGEAAAKALVDATSTLKRISDEKVTVLTEAQTKEVALQKAKDKLQDEATAKAQRSAEDAKRSEHLKLWLMAGLGFLALAAGAAAVFVPVPTVKRYGTIVAIVAGGFALAVPFIQPFHILIALLCVCVPVGLRVAWVYKQEHQDATDTYRALQEVKDKVPEVFKETLKPVLEQWHSPEASKRVDDRLKAVGDV